MTPPNLLSSFLLLRWVKVLDHSNFFYVTAKGWPPWGLQNLNSGATHTLGFCKSKGQ